MIAVVAAYKVNEKVKHGMPLPYEITIRRYSRLALVSLPKSDSEAVRDIESGKVGDETDDTSEKKMVSHYLDHCTVASITVIVIPNSRSP